MHAASEHAVTDDGDELRVNLLIDHDGGLASVRSRIPLDGTLEIRPTVKRPVSVRIPGWCSPQDVEVVDFRGTPLQRYRMSDQRVLVAEPGDGFNLRIPVEEATTHETVNDVSYTVEWRGDTVIAISPAGPRLPLYQRQDAFAASNSPATSLPDSRKDNA